MNTKQLVNTFFFASIIALIAFFGVSYSLGASTPVFNGGGLQEGAEIVRDNIEGTGLVEEGNLVETIIWGIKWLLVISGVLVFIAFLYAGFLYITTYINDKNPDAAKKAMTNAAIGILIIIFSWVIVQFLTTLEFQ